MTKPLPGYTRIYDDHTGRNYTDYSPADMLAMKNDPIANIFKEEIRKAVDEEVMKSIIEGLKK